MGGPRRNPRSTQSTCGHQARRATTGRGRDMHFRKDLRRKADDFETLQRRAEDSRKETVKKELRVGS